MTSCVYKLINVLTDDFYIGSAVNFRRRKWSHMDMLRRDAHHCAALQAAYNKYGPEAFEFEVLQEVDESGLLRVEDMYLAQHAGNAYCYNTALSTTSPPSYTDGVRKKISDSLKILFASDPTLHPRYGTKHSEETKALISANRKGVMAGPSHYRFGKTLSDDVKEKIGVAQRGVRKGTRAYTTDGLRRAQENMRRIAAAHPQEVSPFAAVHAKFPAEVQQRYDFSNAIYTGALARIEGVVCPAHGEFSQYAARFRKGAGCPACGEEKRVASKRKSRLDEWQDPEYRARMAAARSGSK